MLRPDTQLFETLLAGWGNQMLAVVLVVGHWPS